jgi:CRISPR-associated protein Cas1
MKPCTLSTPAVLLAAQFHIPLLLFNGRGEVEARLWEPHFGSTAHIRLRQLHFSESPKGLEWIVENFGLKLQGQLAVLHFCANRVKAQAASIEEIAGAMQKSFDGLQRQLPDQQALLANEARIGKLYWQGLSLAMEKHLPFEGRSRQPADDPFNCLINYGYGMLYALVETCVLTAGLDPHCGVLHAEQYDRPAFVFDAIEPFRPWIDRLAVEMALAKKIQPAWFEEKEQGMWLAAAGKKEWIPAVNGCMEERTLFAGRRIKRRDQVQHRMTTLAQYLLKDYQPKP